MEWVSLWSLVRAAWTLIAKAFECWKEASVSGEQAVLLPPTRSLWDVTGGVCSFRLLMGSQEASRVGCQHVEGYPGHWHLGFLSASSFRPG